MQKEDLRKQIIGKRMALTPDILDKARETAATKLSRMEEYNNAKTVMLYMDFRNEVPTGEIIKAIRSSGKTLILPLTNKDFEIVAYEIPNDADLGSVLAISAFGIAEPNPSLCKEADLSTIDLVVIPGGVFDQFDNRIGYGKGCYDRFLSLLPDKAVKVGLAYDFQILPCIPSDATDAKMNKILTVPSV